MTYFTITPTDNGYVAAWPTKGRVYFTRLDKDGVVLPPGEIKTPGTSGMRSGVIALAAKDGATLVAWKNKDTLGWQLYDAKGQALGNPRLRKERGQWSSRCDSSEWEIFLFPLVALRSGNSFSTLVVDAFGGDHD